ncbi:hypothetical protein T492DRAFT_908117 [Pavlovales sp. CCMP2436]|nr:hypothetical protein T492DRAFT_908117 [Pavlovales sp. CCMP2436]
MARKKPLRASSSDYIFKYAPLAPQYVALGLTDIDQYISNRKLRWAGHVMRMSMSRLPHMFMKSWVNAPRRNGQPLISYGRDLTRELNNFGVNLDGQAVGVGVSTSWGKAAQDKATWLERRGGAARGRCRTHADLALGGVEGTDVTAGLAASPA